MVFIKPPQVILTNKCKDQMAYHQISEHDILYTFNYPHRTTKAWYGTGMYNNERDFSGYTITVVYRWIDAEKKWIITTCWSVSKIRRKSIKWWFAHILGRP